MKKLTPLLLMGLLLVTQLIYAQERTIRGKVTTVNEPEGIPGVTVYVQDNSSVGTTTDPFGNFELTVPESTRFIVFSYIGYEKKILELGSAEEYNILLQEGAMKLDELIVTAVGIKREKKSLGYSAQDVKGDELAETRETNIINAINSKVSGVEITSTSGAPGASSNIVIRGRTSITGSNAPLFVVDGVPIDNSYYGSNFTDQSNRAIDLNADDVASITVLKGPAASALYGIRAANGAIIITTKKSQDYEGRRMTVNFRTSLSFDQVNKLPERQMRYAQGAKNSQGIPSYYGPHASVATSWGPWIDTLRYNGATDYPWDNKGEIVNMSDPDATDARIDPYDNSNAFFNTGVTSNSYLSLGGSSQFANYFTSIGYTTQTGIVPNSTYERLSVKVSGDTELTDKLKLSGSANYINSGGDRMNRGSNLSGVMLGLMRCPVTFDLTNGVKDPVNDSTSYMFPDGTQRTYHTPYDNPYWSVNKNRSTDLLNRVIGNVQLNYELLPWMNIMYRGGLDYYFEERKSYWDNLSNEFGTGFISDEQYSYTGFNSDLILTAEKSLNSSFDLTAVAGHNYFSRRTYYSYQDGNTFILPDFYDISNVSVLEEVDDRTRRYRIVGLYYDLKLAYKKYLYIGTSGRNDWSSTLPQGKNSFFYPSVNVGFIFTEPLGMAMNKYFSYGKIRLSFAEVGHDAPIYSLRSYYEPVPTVYGQTSFLPSTSIGNQSLEPEKTRSIEGGFDLRFFQNRIGMDITLYRSISDGQIMSIPIAYSSGYTNIIGNAGKIENKGIEILLNATPVKKDNFNWDLTLNFSHNKNTVKELAEGVQFVRFEATGLASTANYAIAGEPYGVIVGSRFQRNDAGQLLLQNGYPIMDTNGIIGDPNPDFTLGFRNTFNWKGFRLTALLDFRKGGDIFNGTVGVMRNLGIHKDTESREEEIVMEGIDIDTGEANTIAIKKDEDYYNKYAVSMAGVSEESIEEANWIRLRDISLFYALPAKLINKSPFKMIEVGFTVKNAFLITDYSGIDPETNLSGVSNSFGRDYFNTPNTRSFIFNLQISL